MNKLVRSAQTSQSLSLAAMEEASRLGLREADIDHLFLALVINDQSAGRALRELGIDIDSARLAVEDQRDAQLTSLGIEASFPEAGRIVFHETDGYEWTRRARDLIAKSSSKGKSGDAAAVLRELVAEPSGLITDILGRLGTTPDVLIERLDRAVSPSMKSMPLAAKVKGRTTGTIETFVSAPLDEVWAYLTDPARIPEWEPSIGTLDQTGQEAMPGTVWEGTAPAIYPDGKPVKIKPQFRRRSVELIAIHQPDRIAWSFGYPDVAQGNSILTEFTLANATGGTQLRISRSWSRRQGWRGLVAWPLRPVQKFLVWITLFQTGSAISRTFR
ncbi:Clp protease N-terminal domain-containing protein [Glutamicibacter sp. AOP5-A2-18]|uniref:Clp protease N-terminal domain-containing protein n=1 Tax=Glutamicibacter sp. AOP5-A2-18 TaxID=3457656 RepID=UPI0040346168